jgi:hypothetical protein
MRIAVIIPTTEGPASILRLTPLAQAPRSVLRTQDDYRPLAPSSRYHAFIQPGGALAERIGLGSGQFELRLGAAVQTGRSWELPVALAHWLHMEGHELDGDKAELVIWATGALDNDLRILAQDYHLATKFDRSQDLLKTWLDRAVPVVALVPEATLSPDDLVRARLSWHIVTEFGEATAVVGTALTGNEPSKPGDRQGQPATLERFRSLATGGFIGVALLSLLALIFAPGPQQAPDAGSAQTVETVTAPASRDEDTAVVADIVLDAGVSEAGHDGSGLEATAPESLLSDLAGVPRLILEHAPQGSSCRSVLFGSNRALLTELQAASEDFGVVSSRQLCSIGFTLPDTALAPVEIVLSPILLEQILRSDRRERIVLQPGESRLFRLQADLPRAVEAEVAVTPQGADPIRLRINLQATE